jgi:hypothetical protein
MSEDLSRMKSRSRLQVTFLTMSIIGMALSNNATGAGRDLATWHRSKYRQYANVEATVPTNAPCRTGWWQTLRYGHVRPHWGTLCY